MANVAMLSTMADQEASQLAGAVSDLMPAGVILPYGGATAPAGWLLCNGAQISRTTYAKLFAAIGTAHGSGNGSSTFHLPDLRGRFLRGRDGGAARDPNRTTRTAANSGGATGDAVGSVQGNATRKNGLSASGTSETTTVSGNKNQLNGSTGNQSASHSHYAAQLSGAVSPGAIASAGSGWNCVNTSTRDSSHTTSSQTANHAHSFSYSGTFSASGTTGAGTISVADGDAETRPTNANVNYIIKV